MGKHFKFNEWCDQWLKNSGVNTLEPQVTYSNNNTLSEISIQQFIDPAGKNRLRKSKIDIGIYDQEYKLHMINDFVLSDKNQTNNVSLAKLNYTGPVKAVILNQGDHVYSKVRFDKNTLQSFKQDGLRIQDSLTRALIWRSMWQQVLDLKLSSTEYFNFVLANLASEDTEDTVKNEMG